MMNFTKDLFTGHTKSLTEANPVQIANEIKEHLQTALKSWLEVSKILYNAKKNLDALEFNELKESIPLSDSSICKLIKKHKTFSVEWITVTFLNRNL